MSETYFIREKKEKNFTVISNELLQNADMSFKAKGLLCYLLSLPDDWKIHITELVNHTTDGIDSIRTAVRELEKLKYIKKERKSGEHGYIEWVYKVSETPFADNSPYMENPYMENPYMENPYMENPTLQNTNINKELIKQNTNNTNINTPKEKPKKSNSKAPLFDRIKEYTQNEELREWLGKYLQFKLSTRKNFTLDQWNLLLEDLARYGRGDDKKAIEKVKSSYAKGYHAIVYENEIIESNRTRNTVNTNVIDRTNHKQADIDYSQSAGVIDENGNIGF